MNIIFGENINEIEEKYTVLELDTFRLGQDRVIKTAHCVIESIPINEMSLTESMVELHHNLIENYKKRDWNYCEQAIEQLMGKWGGELDTFYVELGTRISNLKSLSLTDEWSPIIEKL